MVKIATTWLCCCSGCHISMLDLHERFLDLLGNAELVHCPVLMDTKEIPEDIDVVLIEGGIRNEENVEVVEEFRERAEIVVAVGTCACYGGVPGLANMYSNEELLRTVYVETASTENEDGVIPSEDIPELTWRVHPLSDVIDVDYELPGCPPGTRPDRGRGHSDPRRTRTRAPDDEPLRGVPSEEGRDRDPRDPPPG
nr:hypothetical protein [Methanopyrus sp. SNP6]